MKRLPIGISDYKTVIDGNYYYVDKTLLIKELIDSGAAVTLIPRPRRFGKTLNISMLRYFFEKAPEDTRYLFTHTHIWQEDEIRHFQGQFPVIFLTFKDVKEQHWDNAYEKMIDVIASEFNRHYYMIASSISEVEAKDFKDILEKKANRTIFERSLLKLSEILSRVYNQKVVILIDEYDSPINAAYTHNYYTELINFMRSLLTAVLKDNDTHLSRAVITGILRTAKEGIFSGLNNLKVCSLLSTALQDKFGFTQPEVKQFLKDQKLSDKLQQITEWYNGYRIANATIYNPWSIVGCIDERGLIKTYWLNTSDNALIKLLLIRASGTLKSELEDILTHKPLTKEIDEGVLLPKIENNDDAIWNLLLFAGYLTYSHIEWIEGKATCTLAIPNKEVKILYNNLIKDVFKASIDSSKVKELLQALIDGRQEAVQALLQEFIVNSISYYDLPSTEPEKSYHLFILGLLVQLHDLYEVKSNRESGYGRYDIILFPRRALIPGIIIEFKKVLEYENETLEIAAEKALTQIKEKNYIQELQDRDIKNIKIYGMAFQGKKVLVITQK